MYDLTDEQLEYLLDGGDIGYDKASAMARKLTAKTGRRYCVERCSWTGLVGGMDWWEVRTYCMILFHHTVAAFHVFDGKRLSVNALPRT